MSGRYLPRNGNEWLWAAIGPMLVAAQVLIMSTTRGLTHHNAETIALVLPLILGVAIPAAVLLLAGHTLVKSEPTPFIWAALITIGLLMRAVWFGQVPPLDDDFFRYLWDGAVVANGLDPYRYAPGAFLGTGSGLEAYRKLAVGAQGILENVNYNDQRTIYPSVAQLAFALGYLIAPFKIDGLRVVFLAAEIATFVLLIKVLRESGRSPLWSVVYWWNPLAALMAVGLSHVDAIIPPMVIGALLMHWRGRSNWAVALIGLGAGVKIWPLLLAPMVLWPLVRTPRKAFVASMVLGGTLLAALGPVIWSALQPGSGLTAYASQFSSNNAFYSWTLVGINKLFGQPEGGERMLRLVLAGATAVIALAQAFRGNDTLDSILSRGLIVAASLFYLSPAQFPWYAIWFLPLATLRGCWPLLLATAVLPFFYLYYPPWSLPIGSLLFYGIAFIHSLPVLGWLLYDAVAGRHQPAGTSKE